MITRRLVDEFIAAASGDEAGEIAPAGLLMARLAYPRLDIARYLGALDALGAAAGDRLARAAVHDSSSRVGVLNRFLFEEEQFSGNRTQYDDERNSFLNEVMDRRTGIPISLGVIYIEVARRAGMAVNGVSFPGHFLLRYSGRGDDLIIDPFDGGTILSEHRCEALLRQHAGDAAVFSRELLAPATKRQILTRMLSNLKRVYVRLQSFPQAHDVIELLVALDPSSMTELRDRGLIASQLNDVAGALRDLETYLRLKGPADPAEEDKEEREQIWEHVKGLRRRLAGLN